MVMFSWEYPPHIIGGLGKHVTELTPALVRRGMELDLISPAWAGGAHQEVSDGVRVHRVPAPSATDGDIYDTARRTNSLLAVAYERVVARSAQPEVLHAHDWLVALAAINLKRTHRVPLVCTIHATEQGRNNGHLRSDLQRAINSVE